MENKELKLYNIDSIELYELIDSSRIKLKRNNLEYKNLYEQFHKIMNNFGEREIFFLGAREAYYYFKNIGIIK